jgi:hypothetical protein
MYWTCDLLELIPHTIDALTNPKYCNAIRHNNGIDNVRQQSPHRFVMIGTTAHTVLANQLCVCWAFSYFDKNGGLTYDLILCHAQDAQDGSSQLAQHCPRRLPFMVQKSCPTMCSLRPIRCIFKDCSSFKIMKKKHKNCTLDYTYYIDHDYHNHAYQSTTSVALLASIIIPLWLQNGKEGIKRGRRQWQGREDVESARVHIHYNHPLHCWKC